VRGIAEPAGVLFAQRPLAQLGHLRRQFLGWFDYRAWTNHHRSINRRRALMLWL